jgi:hypothetical protein
VEEIENIEAPLAIIKAEAEETNWKQRIAVITLVASFALGMAYLARRYRQ